MNKTQKYVAPNLFISKSTSIFMTVIASTIKGYYVGLNGIVEDNSIILHLDPSQLESEVFESILSNEICSNRIDFEGGVLVTIKNTMEGLNEKFIKGEYSEMYTLDFALGRLPFDTRKVILKDPNYRSYLEAKLAVSLAEDAELDSPPNLEQETLTINLYEKEAI